MATIRDAVAARALEPFDLPEWERRQPLRLMWIVPELWEWAVATPELHDARLGLGGRTLYEHLEQTFSDFRCADRFHAGDLRRMNPTKKGVWKMHPPRLRIYGWCPGKHMFAAAAYALESETKTNKKLNDKKRDEVLAFIKRHKLEATITRGDVLAVFPQEG